MEPNEDQGIFIVWVPGVEFAASDELGVWQAQPRVSLPRSEQFYSYDLPASGSRTLAETALVDTLTWQVQLPEDPHLAARTLDLQSARLSRTETALPSARHRLAVLASGGVLSGEAFASGASLPPAERELAAWLQAGRGAQDFASLQDMQAGLAEAAGQLAGFSTRLQLALANFAQVQTSTGGRLVAHTLVGWSGDVDTAWETRSDSRQAGLHERSLALALASRQAWIRLGILLAGAAVRLAALLPAGPMALLAIPAAYRYVTQVLAEIRT